MTFTQLPNLALARQVMMVPSDFPLPVTQIQIIRDAVLNLRGGEESKSADDIVFSFKEELQKIRSELEREAAMEMHAAKEELQFLEKKKSRLEVGKKEKLQTEGKHRAKVEELDEQAESFEESHVQKGESMDIKSTDEGRAEDFKETSDNGNQKMEYHEENNNVESSSECEIEPGVVEEDHVESSGGEDDPETSTAVEEDHIESSGCESDPESITVVEEENEERSKEFADSSTLSSNKQVPANGEIGKGQNEALEKEETTLIDADNEQESNDDDNENTEDKNICQIDSLQEKSQSKTKQKKGPTSSKKINRDKKKKKKRQKERKKIEEAVYFDEDDRDTFDMVSILEQEIIEKESLLTTIAKGLVPTSVVIIGLLIMNYILEQILKNI